MHRIPIITIPLDLERNLLARLERIPTAVQLPGHARRGTTIVPGAVVLKRHAGDVVRVACAVVIQAKSGGLLGGADLVGFEGQRGQVERVERAAADVGGMGDSGPGVDVAV